MLTILQTAELNNSSLLRERLVNDVDINAVDADGNTALHIAVRNRNMACVHYLLKHDAVTDIKNKVGMTALDMADGLIEEMIEQKRLEALIEGIDLTADDINKGFPSKWNLKGMTKADVEEFLSEELPDLDADMQTKSKMNSSIWHYKRLKTLLDKYSTPGDTWCIYGSRLLAFWDCKSKERDEPIGFAAFSVGATRSYEEGVIDNSLKMKLNLVWIRPDLRGMHLSKHLAAHTIAYLRDCQPINLLGDDSTWRFCYEADFYTLGGESFSWRIQDELSYLSEWDEDWECVDEPGFEVGF